MKKYKNVLTLTNIEAKKFFLKQENYCNIELPYYFKFEPLLQEINTFISGKQCGSYQTNLKPDNISDVNTTIYHTKDGKYQWRPLQIIHPVLYVKLVNIICKDENWNAIKKRFKTFYENPKIECKSMPVLSGYNRNSKSSVILNWWENIEQNLITESLNFSYIFCTDITDFYPSIYTHTISWALHGKKIAKEKRGDKNLLGNKIDSAIMSMQYGQTNGIPQGSTLMDFIAEMVLGYADSLLSEKLEEEKITDYKILRYRDDYKILVNDFSIGEKILKLLTEVLLDLSLKLNTSKTIMSEDIIASSIKKDKLEWIGKSDFMLMHNPSIKCKLHNKEWKFDNQQQTLLGIYQFSKQYPNSGTVSKLLSIYLKKFTLTSKDNINVLISILTTIMITNIKSYPQGSALLSRLLMKVKESDRLPLLTRIHNKLKQKPHTDFLDIWLQRVSWKIDNNYKYDSKLCEVVINPKTIPWNNNWVNEDIKSIFTKNPIVDRKILSKMPKRIKDSEVDFLSSYSY